MTEILNLNDFLRIPFLSSMFYKSGIICTNYIRWNINTGPGLWISEHQLNRKYSTWHKGRLLTSWNGSCLSVCLYLHPLLYKGHACTGTPGRRLAAFFQRLQRNFSLSAGHVVAAMCCPLHFHLCVQTEIIFLMIFTFWIRKLWEHERPGWTFECIFRAQTNAETRDGWSGIELIIIKKRNIQWLHGSAQPVCFRGKMVERRK